MEAANPAGADAGRGLAVDAPGRTADRTAPAEDREAPARADGGSTKADTGEAAPAALLRGGPTLAAAPSGEIDPQTQRSGETAPAHPDTAPPSPFSLSFPSPLSPSSQPVGQGLEELYRRTVQAARPAMASPAAPQAGQSVRLGEPEAPRQLTVDELDRAVRRDSRRYDGGMTLF